MIFDITAKPVYFLEMFIFMEFHTRFFFSCITSKNILQLTNNPGGK